MLEVIIYCLVALVILFTIFYVIALIQGIWNTVDIAYGTGFILMTLIAFFLSENPSNLRGLIVNSLVILWGIRIAYFLTIRKYGKDKVTNEDKRFKNFRDNWGSSAVWRGYFFLFLPQVFFVLIVGFPVLVINTYGNQPLNMIDSVGLLIVFFSITLEAISDYQMNSFKSKPINKGKVYTGGLWKYSQHPNYFFEILVWIGFWIIALFSVPSEQILWAIFSIIGPILITLSLLRVSGIPLLKRRFEDNSEYSDYQKKTSLLIPWFPKK